MLISKTVKTLIVIGILLSISTSQIYFSPSQTISLRLHPNQDIIGSLTKILSQYHYTAMSISAAVGSVNYCWLRFANNSFLSHVQGPLEITALSGTFDLKMQPHIHIQLANGKGECIGGHLPSLEERAYSTKNGDSSDYDCPIFTTLELVLLHHTQIIYERKIDPETTFHELFIRSIWN